MVPIQVPTVVIIGNGFDRSLNLPTSYDDFMKSEYFTDLISANNSLCDHLKYKNDFQNWIDIEKELILYSQELTAMYVAEGEVLNERYYIVEFEKEFKNLVNALCEYMSTITYQVDKEERQYEFFKHLAKSNFEVFNFNYTNTVDLILEELRKETQIGYHNVNKVHGSVEKGDIIIGIQDLAGLRDEHIFLQKSFNPNHNPKLIKERLKACTRVIFLGHSIGETDFSYFQSFFEEASNLSTGGPKTIVLFSYGDKGYKDLLTNVSNLSNKNLHNLRSKNRIIHIDSSKDSWTNF